MLSMSSDSRSALAAPKAVLWMTPSTTTSGAFDLLMLVVSAAGCSCRCPAVRAERSSRRDLALDRFDRVRGRDGNVLQFQSADGERDPRPGRGIHDASGDDRLQREREPRRS